MSSMPDATQSTYKSNGLSNGHAKLAGIGDGRRALQSLNPTLGQVLPEEMENGTELSGVSQKVFLDRYSLKDRMGNPLEKYPEQMFLRVARAISRVEKPER